jgi:two-component system chemotaxis response regulator CheB
MLGGFGMDGVEGLTKIQDKGGMTAVQTPAQAAFPYAPQKAIELGVAAEILNVEDMSAHIFTYRNQSVSKAA